MAKQAAAVLSPLLVLTSFGSEERVIGALWIVLTQQSVFKKRPLVSLLHALVFYGFVYYFLVNVVDAAEKQLEAGRSSAGTLSDAV